MKDKNRILRKALSLVLSFAVILPATVSLGGESEKAQAKTSLPYIEGLKTAGSTFNILEIVPAAGQGSIGYYIKGQEPCANWMYDVAAISGQAARETYMNNSTTGMLSKLKTANILGSGDTTPLESTGAYDEVYPWQNHPATDYTKLTLNIAEQTTAKGTFTPASDGAFTQSTGFTPQTNGAYVQVIKKFVAGTVGDGQYYYVPTFTPVPINGTIPDNTAVYTNTATINNPSADPTDDGYVYYGTTGTGFEGMEIGTKYYYVTSYGAPSLTKPTDVTEKNYYVGISDSYRLKTAGETGYFKINAAQLIYTYVGSGGTYNFNYDESSTTSNNVKCNTVYYTGGYTNNNWFLRNVFDWDTGDTTAKIKFKVTSVVGSSATVEQVDAANLIILSYGFNPYGSITSYTSANDISTTSGNNVSSAITAAVSNTPITVANNRPIIVDYRLYSINNTKLRTLARNLYNSYNVDSNTNFVYKNAFFFAPDTSGTPRRAALATQYFCSNYSPSSYNVSGSAFYDAYEVAVYENFIRDEERSTAGHLETDVNMARAIRYIINFKGQRKENGKSSINVLEIEPNNTQRLTSSSYKTLTGYTGDVTITCMSTLEFVGKSDDLIENYDAIYIGNNGGNSLSDSMLDGDYLYENIGAPVKIRDDAVGLTDAEYSDTTFTGADGETYNSLKSPQMTRYSGNDLSTKKLAALNAYALAGHPVIIANSLTCQYSINAIVSGVPSADGTSAILTASASVVGVNPAASDPYYTWYKKSGNSYYSTYEHTTTYSATSGEYYCRIRYTIDGDDYYAYSNSVVVATTAAQTSLVLSGSDTTGTATYDYDIWWYPYSTYHATETFIFDTYVSGNGRSIITGYATSDGSGWSPTYALQWYKDDAPVGGVSYVRYGSNTFTPPTDSGVHYYYCKINLTSITNNGTPYNLISTPGQTKTATVTNTPASTVITPGTTVGTPITDSATAGQPYFINDNVVDNCSNMYSFLNGNKSRGNVMRSGDIDKDALLRYTNTSEPKINFADSSCYPAVYARSTTLPYSVSVTSQLAQDPGSNPATYTLKYDFKITNSTDTTPDTTEYYCNLYIDTDSDSRFIEQERIGNIEIHEATAGVAGTLVDSGTLKAGQEYIVTRTLSAGMDGFLPWKLEVIKVSDESVHTSTTNYTYVKPKLEDAEIINILQISPGSGGGLQLDTAQTISDTGIRASRDKILRFLSYISSDYTINIQTITTTQAHNIASVPITNTLVKDTSENLHAPYTDVKQLIYSYDMVIIGFDDCYQELDEATSTAIVDYLKDNHPILYSHDTTSLSNVPKVYNTNKSSSNYQSDGTYWGYYFNSVLRDPLGLDRYGVTSSVFGLTSKSSPLPLTTTSGLVAAGYSGLDTAKTEALQKEGYSIAYLPGSNTAGTGGTPIGTTQGFTNYMHSGNMTSTAVTQVNKGMITTYPFDLNLTPGSSSTMTINETHQQYYQANMNPDDVLVWYCLSGSGFDYNDAASAYYIFSNGNATYSGFGHNLKNIGDAEAKLFVNSIIAAYRITNFPPVVTFTDASGNNKLNAFLVPADSDGTLLPAAEYASASDTSRYLYFTVDDSNVAKDKTVRAVVSYSEKEGTELNVPIYDSQTNKAIESGANLVTGLAYYFKIDEIIKALGELKTPITISKSGTPVYVTAITHLRGEDMEPVTESITLRQLILFDLG